ncbi:response regulator transcription factor [Clostridium gasigenes]|uniref:Stage 0 sporulation protein A homolog n=1 Tax=Clostridium gasigenes TaxID=94869 RepID=A0A7X0SBH0_9CLOT|nr:response regulator transcription factor [Clostridium gasigenes]MBB6713122.1 response regulator transcription factor [Clostridium gasigenes]
MVTILLIEDDEDIAISLSFTLEVNQYKVILAKSIYEATKKLEENNIDLILLDKNLPDGDGIVFCKRLRNKYSIPIIVVTAANTEVDMVNALTIGADDYITKPFVVSVFMARIKALLRRVNKIEKEKMIKSNEIIYYKETMKVEKNGVELSLNKREFELLSLFLYNPKSILSKNKILDKIWQQDGEYVDENIISVNIRRLREKIEDNPSDPKYIYTIRGLGYSWQQECEYR